MAQPQRQAVFFVAPDGVVIPKAPPLLHSFKFRYYNASDKRCAQCRRKVKFGGTTHSPFDLCDAPGHIDHILPRSRGGQNNPENLQLLCLRCNCSKGAA